MKNENSSCEDWRFFQNKVPNQFPEIVMKYAYKLVSERKPNLHVWINDLFMIIENDDFAENMLNL